MNRPTALTEDGTTLMHIGDGLLELDPADAELREVGACVGDELFDGSFEDAVKFCARGQLISFQ